MSMTWEAQSGNASAFGMPIVPRAPRVSQICGTRDVVDNPGLAWSVCDQSPYDYLPTDLVDTYRWQLDIAATELFGPVLATCWEARGYDVTFGTRDEAERFPAPTWLYHAVWNDAAALLDPDLIVSAAGLDDERRIYS